MKPKKLLNALKHMDEVYEGIKNVIFKKDHVEAIANERWKTCKNCPLVDLVGTECAAPGTEPCCSDCGCSLAFKLRSLSSSCPKEKWFAIMNEEQEEKLKKEIGYED